MKKLSFVCLILALIALLAVGVSAQTKTYPDVPANSWYHEAVMKASELGIVGGMPDGTFAPKASLTRAQYVTILQRLDGAEDDTTGAFKDVTAKTWYAGAVGWAVKAGIVGGYEDGTFRGNNAISRQDLMVMTSRYLDYAWLGVGADPEAASSFSDNAKISSYARDAVNKMREIGLVKGDNAGAFNPKKTATRAEIATMIVRLTDSINTLGDEKTIGGTDASAFTVYSEFLSDEGKAKVAESFGKKIGKDVKVSSTPAAHSIIFGYDGSLKRLQYSVSEKDGNLYFNVSTKYAVEYFPQIVEDALSRREHVSIPDDSVSYAAYTLDRVMSCKPNSIYYNCETDKNPLSYNVGDQVTYMVTLLSDGKLVSTPCFHYMYRNESGKIYSAVADGKSGQFIVTFEGSNKPGVGKLSVGLQKNKTERLYADEPNSEMIGSVVFGFNEIATLEKKPDDFDEFWKAQVKELMKVEPKAIKFEECPYESDADYIVYDAVIESVGDPAVCHIAVPRNAEPHSLKITGSYLGYAPPMSARTIKDPGTIRLEVNSHSIESHLDSSAYSALADKLGSWGFDDHGGEVKDCFFYDMLMRDIQAIRFAEIQFADLWDGATVTTFGNSMGAFQAVAVATMYDKVDKIEVNIPWLCNISGDRKSPHYSNFMPNYDDVSKYFDTTYFAESFKGEAVITGGLGDKNCPPLGVVALYNALNTKKEITFTQCLGHGDDFGKY
ncbi:MAG: S-layer homology domain-containing protein, partial [Clostridia bacterium]|nr:S-layer homology domain-containing protein [Clostridia bacterium]